VRLITYAVRRLALVAPTLLGVITIVFVFSSSIPVYDQLVEEYGNSNNHYPCGYQPTCPCGDLYPGETGTCANPVHTRLAHGLGLNEPIPYRYLLFVYRALTFQWGTVSNFSAVEGTYPFAKDRPVAGFLGEMLPSTLELAGVSLLIIVAITVPLISRLAVGRNRALVRASRAVTFPGLYLPSFLVALLVLFAAFSLVYPHTGLSVRTPWCPSGEVLYAFTGPSELTGSWPAAGCYQAPVSIATGCATWLSGCLVSHPTGFPTVDAVVHGQYWLALDTVLRLILPALVLAYGSMYLVLRFVRSSLSEETNRGYVRTARANGVPESTILSKYVGRSSLAVNLSALGLTITGFFGGFLVVENIFYLNGVGRVFVLAAQPGGFDFAVLFGCMLLFAYLIAFARFVIDVAAASLDPRLLLGEPWRAPGMPSGPVVNLDGSLGPQVPELTD